MSREIKFRAWDPVIGRMIEPSTVEDIALRYFRYSEIQPLQFTGLTDKNGKDIYEGDILEIELSTPDIFKIEVFFGEDAAFYGRRVGAGTLYSIGFSGSVVVRREVIGNIYENPELLEFK